MVIVLGQARIRPEQRAVFAAAAASIVRETRQEPGVHTYGFYADIADPDLVMSVEVWANQDALDAHMDHSHTTEFLTRVAELIDGEPVMSIHHTSDQVPGGVDSHT
ncbi:putative quinol monooxygenase [Gordonia sp. NPDC003424]